MPILSIVIPTKNRYEYLKILLSKLCKEESLDFELIIHDNSDQPIDFQKYITELDDNRIRYFYLERSIPVTENCELAVSKAIGEYVCMIGDDDGILVNPTINILQRANNLNIDSIIPSIAIYTWPDVHSANWGNSLSGKLNFNKIDMLHFYPINVLKELQRVLRCGASFGVMDLPRVYQGFIKRTKLLELKKNTGTFFPGPSPDMANAVGLAMIINSHFKIDAPLIISGASSKSTSGLGLSKKHYGKIEDQKHLPKNTSSNWSKLIPKFWSGATIYSESAKCAIELSKKEKIFKINFYALYASCFIFEPYAYKEIINTVKNNFKGFRIVFASIFIILYMVKIFTLRLKIFFKNYIRYKRTNDYMDYARDIREVIEKIEDRIKVSSK